VDLPCGILYFLSASHQASGIRHQESNPKKDTGILFVRVRNKECGYQYQCIKVSSISIFKSRLWADIAYRLHLISGYIIRLDV
jgi:hypothetical protein